MSENSFPFAEAEDASVDDEGAAVRSRRAVLAAGGVAAVLVLGLGGYFLMGSSGDSTVTNAAVVPGTSGPHTLRPAVKAAVKPVNKLPAAYNAPLGRDPFKALYVVPAAAVAAGTTTTSPTSTTSTGTGSTTTTGTGTPTATGTGTTTPTSTGPSGTGTTTPTSTRYTLKLVSISKPSPEVRFTTWKVGTDSKTVIPAQRFGKYGEIVVLAFSKNAAGAVDKAIIQVGDDSPMDVSIGESVSVL